MASTISVALGVEGAKQFQNSMKQSDASVKALGAELKLAVAEMGRAENAEADLKRQNDILAKEITALNGKLTEQEKALESVKKAFGDTSPEALKLSAEISKTKTAIANVENSIRDNNNALNNMGKELKDTGKQASVFGDVLKANLIGDAIKGGLKAIGSAAKSAMSGIKSAVMEVASAGDEIDKMSQKIGISAEAFQQWDYVFERSGADVNSLQASMKTLSAVIVDAGNGSASAAEKLEAVGLSIEDLNDLSQEEQLSVVIAAIQEMGTGAERTAAATDLLGKSATDMAAIFNMTAEETAALKQEAVDMGMVMSGEDVAAAAAFDDAMTKMEGTMNGLKTRIVGTLLPALTNLMEGFADLAAGNEEADARIKAGFQGILDAVKAIIPQISTIVKDIVDVLLDNMPELLKAAWELVKGLARGLLEALPVVIKAMADIFLNILTAIGEWESGWIEAGANLIAGLWQGIKDMATWLKNKIKDFCSGIVDWVKGLFGVHSPSTVFAGIGGNMAEGMGVGFIDSMRSVEKQMAAAMPNLTGSVSMGAVGAVGAGGAVGDIVINLTSEIDGQTLARNQFRYNAAEMTRHGGSLVMGG